MEMVQSVFILKVGADPNMAAVDVQNRALGFRYIACGGYTCRCFSKKTTKTECCLYQLSTATTRPTTCYPLQFWDKFISHSSAEDLV